MNKLFQTLSCLFIIIFFSSSSVKASHSVGANITYEHILGNTYRITLYFYRDCSGIAAPSNPFISIYSNNCNISTGVNLTPLPGTGQEIIPFCIEGLSTCRGGNQIGVQEWVYDALFTFPASCTDWIMSFELCCRNAAITTITNPGNNTFFVYSMLNNTILPRNNSPEFLTRPVPFTCLNKTFCYDNETVDVDGDSIVYSLITPLQNSNTTVQYIIPYTNIQPLTSSPPMTFDNETGVACMFPTNTEITVLAVLVSEYRNGVLIGQVERDMQLIILPCNCDPLPVELLDFYGNIRESKTDLYWATATEINNDYFIIEKSSTDLEFQSIGIVEGAGNSNQNLYYQFTDNNPFKENYYRLLQVDFDGTRRYSNTICITMDEESEIDYIQVYDIYGRKILTTKDRKVVFSKVENQKVYFLYTYFKDGNFKTEKFIKF